MIAYFHIYLFVLFVRWKFNVKLYTGYIHDR